MDLEKLTPSKRALKRRRQRHTKLVCQLQREDPRLTSYEASAKADEIMLRNEPRPPSRKPQRIRKDPNGAITSNPDRGAWLEKLAIKHGIYAFVEADRIAFFDSRTQAPRGLWISKPQPHFVVNGNTYNGTPIDALRAIVAPAPL